MKYGNTVKRAGLTARTGCSRQFSLTGGTVSGFLDVALLCIILICAVPGAGIAAEVRTISLEQALKLALEKNHDIEKAREYANYVQGKYLEERAAALPQLSLNGSAVIARDESQKLFPGADAEQYTRTLDLTLSQPLYTWGRVRAAIRAAEVGLKTADEQLRIYRQAALRDVTIAFYDILLAKELHLLSLENLQQKRRHQDEAQRRFDAGVATDYDVLAADVAVQNARPVVIRTENSIKTAQERLSFLLALGGGELNAAGTLDVAPGPLESYAEALSRARTRRPDLADLRYRINIYNELVTIAEAENKPRLDLKGGLGWHHLDTTGLKADGAAWSVGVYLTFPFFDGFRTDGRVQQARNDLRNREIEEAKLLDSFALEVRTAVNGVRESAEILSALTGTVRQAERLLEMAEKGFEYGVKIRLEVDDAQVNLLQAKINLARARRDYLVTRATLDWTEGIIGETGDDGWKAAKAESRINP